MHDEAIYAERALKAGANGYIMKQELGERLISAIRTVMRGEIYLSEAMSSRILGKMVGGHARKENELTPMERLSDRELEVFEMLGRGLNTREIAEKLCLSIKTVETHREHIKEKLGISDATKLIQQATHWVIGEGQSHEHNDI
jgi:DNA-binding NarL/FixJ family response regulator